MYIITNNKNYISISGSKYRNVGNMSVATIFQDEDKANDAVKNMPKSFKNLGYRVVPINMETKTDSEGNEVSLISKEDFIENIPDKIREPLRAVLEAMKEYSDITKTLTPMEEALRIQQKEAETEIFDIEHAAELFPKLNCPKAYKIYQLLRDARIKRRKAKDALRIIEIVKEEGLVGVYTGKILSRIDGLYNNRKYSPRILTELFDQE